MLHRPLTVLNAEIKTAAVEIRTLTVGGKQVTLAVFRQLHEEKLVNRDGTLNGTPWGIVNYHPDKCGDLADYAPHIHVVWQRGTDLLRSTVWLPQDTPKNFNCGFDSTFYSVNGDAALTFSVYRDIKEGRLPPSLTLAALDDYFPTKFVCAAPGLSKLCFNSVQTARPGIAQAAWLATRDKTAVLNNYYEQWFRNSKIDLPKYVDVHRRNDESSEDYTNRHADANKDRICSKVLERVMQKLAGIVADGVAEAAEVAFKQELAAEIATRKAYIKAVDALACLPQLFIAV
jgi:hypothetical protein